MSDNTPDKIRQALAEATPGKWRQYEGGGVYCVLANDSMRAMVCDRLNAKDADLIAQAPEWLRWALGEIERLQEFERLAAELATEQRYAKEQSIKWNDEAVKLKRLYADKCRDWGRVVDEHNQMRAKLDAKDKEIAELKHNREGVMNYLDNLHMTASGEPAMIFMTMLVELFEQNGGKNFLTLTVEKPDKSERYSITIQNLNGELTPSEKMDQMQAEIAFWKEAAETQKDNNLAILVELQSLKEPNT